MKSFLFIVTAILLLVGFSPAEPAVTCIDNDECCVYVEDISNNTDCQTVQAYLGLEPFSTSEDKDTWRYYIIYSEPAKIRILNAFLPHLEQYHRHSKLPFSAVAEYWEKLFRVPIQIFVFCTDENLSEQFSTSRDCEKIVTTARILDLGFMWNGALGIAETDIKQILEVPADHHLVTTIFLSHVDKEEVSRAKQ